MRLTRYGLGLVFSLAALAPAGALRLADFPAESADLLVQRVAGPVTMDREVETIGRDLASYAPHEAGVEFSFRVVETRMPVVLALPNGSIYLSRGVLDAVGNEPQKLAFLCASELSLVLDGVTQRAPEVVRLITSRAPSDPLPVELVAAVEQSLTAERMLDADRTSMLYLSRAGISPLYGVRALEDLSARGRRDLCLTQTLTQPASLLDRKVKGMRAVSDLVAAATEFDFGVMDLVDRRYDSALARFEKFLEVFPNNYAGWNNLGLCYYHRSIRNLPTGRWLLADAIAEFDTSFMTRKNANIMEEDWERAKSAYEKALGMDPDRVEALCNLGNLYVVDLQDKAALPYYERALKTQADYAPALNNYGVALADQQTGDFPGEALVKFASAASADPTLPEAQFNLGMAHAEVGMDDWRGYFERYLALAPSGSKAQYIRRMLRPNQDGVPQPEEDPNQPVRTVTDVERALELGSRARLALDTQERQLLAMLETRPDQQRDSPGRDVKVCGWSRQGLVVELVRGAVNRVVAGRPPGLEASTERGVKVGFTTSDIRERYGTPPAVSRQNPYDIWLYPKTGVGFFVLGQQVNKIFLFPVSP